MTSPAPPPMTDVPALVKRLRGAPVGSDQLTLLIWMKEAADALERLTAELELFKRGGRVSYGDCSPQVKAELERLAAALADAEKELSGLRMFQINMRLRGFNGKVFEELEAAEQRAASARQAALDEAAKVARTMVVTNGNGSPTTLSQLQYAITETITALKGKESA